MGVASECEIRGVGRLMMVGMVLVAVVRVVDPVIFRFKICLFTFHTSAYRRRWLLSAYGC